MGENLQQLYTALNTGLWSSLPWSQEELKTNLRQVVEDKFKTSSKEGDFLVRRIALDWINTQNDSIKERFTDSNKKLLESAILSLKLDSPAYKAVLEKTFPSLAPVKKKEVVEEDSQEKSTQTVEEKKQSNPSNSSEGKVSALTQQLEGKLTKGALQGGAHPDGAGLTKSCTSFTDFEKKPGDPRKDRPLGPTRRKPTSRRRKVNSKPKENLVHTQDEGIDTVSS